jgi:hypothetical protein
MRGIRRANGIVPNGKAPILTPLLRRMVAALPDDLPVNGFAFATYCHQSAPALASADDLLQ